MNGLTPRTRLAGLAVVTALAAMALPSPALAGNSHLLKLYKVEQHVDLQGEDGVYTVTCPNNDLAMDGMWRVDDVEQDNDYFYGGPGGTWSTTSPPNDPDHPDWDVLRSVRPVKAASVSPSSYEFKFTPLSGGDVQIKLWVTCIGDKSESIGGHTVSWDPGPLPTAAFSDPAPAFTPTPAVVAGATSVSTTNACPSGYIVTSPGFEVTNGDADLVASYPTSSTVTQWNWVWKNADPTFTAKHTWRCLRLKSDVASSGPAHTHRIVKRMATKFSPSNKLFKKKGTSEVQLACGEHYKGLIGGWNYSSFFGFQQFHFLGMDPRIKTRAFKFLSGYGVDKAVDGLYLVCFKDKTS